MERHIRFREQSPVDAHIGTRIRMRRMILGMSQEELGAAIGVAFQQVQKYERGVNRVSASRLHALAQVLGVPISFFFDELGPDDGDAASGPSERAAASDVPDSTSRETLELLRAYYGILDPQLRRGLFEIAKAIARTGSEND